MALVRLAERAPLPAPSQSFQTDYSLTEVSFVLHDLSWRSSDGFQTDLQTKLENEVMVDPWSSMDSTNSPLTDSGPSEECTPSTSSEPQAPSPLSPQVHRTNKPNVTPDQPKLPPKPDKLRSRDLRLDLETRRPHFLDDDFQPPPSKTHIECPLPKPHFLDHIPSPDELDDRSDITNSNFLVTAAETTQNAKRSGALPKRPQKPTTTNQDDRLRTGYRSTLHHGLDNAARAERDKRTSQLYRGTWPGEREWTGQDTASIRSFSSNGSTDAAKSSSLENKMECVYSLLSLLTLSPDNNADLSGPLLDMSRSVESCIAMRQAGCMPLLVQLIHSKQPRETRDRAAKALRNIIHTQTDDRAGRREARVWRLLEQVREYCYALENVVEARKEGKEITEDDTTKHPSQSVAALMKLSFDEEHRHVVCQLGGLQALAALVSGDQAAHGSRSDDSTCLTMRKYAGMTLTNLTFGDGNNKSLLCSFKDFMTALVEQLESPNDDMRQVTAAVLRNLSWRADTNSKQVLREVGAVKGLTKAAMTCQKEATLKSVLSALWNLTAHCSMNKVALCSVDGALGFLVEMLSYDSPTKTLAIVENAGGIMRNVSSHIAVREDYRQILRERNCLSVLLQHLKSPSLTVVSNSCGTLWNLSARCPIDQQFLWDQGAVPMLRSLIHSKHKMIAMGSSAALKNLLNSKPGKAHMVALDATARNMNLPALPTLGERKQKALEQELDQNLAETCDNMEPATSPSTTNRDEKNLFTATERKIAMNLERHRMTSSSPLMGTMPSQISLSHSAHLASYLSCSNTMLKSGSLVSRSSAGSSNNVNRSDSKDSVTSAQSDTVFEKMRTGKVPVPTPRNKDLVRGDSGGDTLTASSKTKDTFRYSSQPPIPPPRTTDMRTNYTESGYDVDQDSCDQPIDFSKKYSETKTAETVPAPVAVKKTKDASKKGKKDGSYGDYQETDLDQPTNYSLRYAEHQSDTSSESSEPANASVHEDTIKRFAAEGTPYETPIIFSTATSMSDLRVIGKDGKPKTSVQAKENPEVMTHSDEKDTCSIEDPPRHDNERIDPIPEVKTEPVKEKVFDTKFSSGMISPEKPISYCDEGTPGYFSRVSSLSSLGEPTEEDHLAKKNAIATITTDPDVQDQISVKDKEGSKAVTFATDPVSVTEPATPGVASSRNTPPPLSFVEDTPLMFSRSSSLGSLPDCDQPDDQGSVLSEISRLTSGCISPSEIPDSPGMQSAAVSPRPRDRPHTAVFTEPTTPTRNDAVGSVFEERATTFLVENTPAHFSTATSLSSLTIDDELDRKGPLPEKEDDFDDQQSDILNHSASNLDCSTSNIFATRNMTNPIESTPAPTADSCRVYVTEDTPALSKAGSRSDLSVLSVLSVISSRDERDDIEEPYADSKLADTANVESAHPPCAADSSDSSNLSDDANLLEECIQKGIAKTTNKSVVPKPESPLPPCAADSSDSSNLSDDTNLLEECIQKGIDKVVKNKGPQSETGSVGSYIHKDGPYRSLPPFLQSSTETVKMAQDFVRGVRDSAAPGALQASPPPPLPPRGAPAKTPPPRPPRTRDHRRKHESRLPIKSERSTRDKPKATNLVKSESLSSLSLDSFGSTDREIFEQTVNAGVSVARNAAKAHSVERRVETKEVSQSYRRRHSAEPVDPRRRNRPDQDVKPRLRQHRRPDLTRSPYSYHGDSNSTSLVHQSRNSGPRSLPAPLPNRVRSPSPSSLSNDSFGSTDAEVFERCVRIGMSRGREKPRDGKDKSRRKPEPHALERMAGDEYSKERAILEEVIARGAGDISAKNEMAPFAECAPADGSAKPRANISMAGSNERLASLDTTLQSEQSELNRSNESYAEAEDPSDSDHDITERDVLKPVWTELKITERVEELESRRSADTWNDNTCPDDVTFPTISGSVHMVASIRGELADHSDIALPDLLETSEGRTSSRPDLTNRLGLSPDYSVRESSHGLEGVPEPSFASLLEGEPRLDSMMSSEIEREAARLAAQLKDTEYMESSVNSLASLDLEQIRPPSNLGSLLSLSASAHLEDNTQKKTQRSRKKSLPIALVKRALTNSQHHGSSEHLDQPASLLDHVKPPSEMEHLDMESSMLSVSSIVSEIAENRERTPVVFDFKQPILDFPGMYHDLNAVNPPSLFDEIAESTVEFEPTTACPMYEDCLSTLNVTDIPSGSENCTPIPSDLSSVESTPKRQRDPKYMTPKEKRQAAKDRYQTYTINDTLTDNDATLVESEYLTWTRSDDSRSEEYVTATSEVKGKRRSAKQRRIDDRARYQTQTVDVHSVLSPDRIETEQKVKKTMKQKRADDAERYRTRTLSDDVPPSPTFISKDSNLETVETTTGYDSFSSNETGHQRLSDGRDEAADSGHHEDDAELDSPRMQTYTRGFRNYLPVTESPAALDLCLENNLRNMEHDPQPEPIPRPKIVKPSFRRDASLDSDDSREPDTPKAIRGRKKASYVSPYRRTTPAKPTTAIKAKTVIPKTVPKPQTSAKVPVKTPSTSKASSATTSPKKIPKSPSKIAQKTQPSPLPFKPLPLERQGTFTKEETAPKALPKTDKFSKPGTSTANTSPSRLPQLNKFTRPQLRKTNSNETAKKPNRSSAPAIKNSASNHSLQSNDSGKTVTLGSKSSRQGSTSSVNSATTKSKDVESRIAGLWKRVEQSKKQPTKPDRRVWIESEKVETPKLIRSSTFDGQPQPQVSAAPKQKTAIGIRVTQIPKPKTGKVTASTSKKPNTRVFAKKQINGQT